MKTEKFPIVRNSDNIKPIPDSATRPTNQPSAPRICELDQLLSEILQMLKKQRCILYNYPVESEKNGKILIPEDFHRVVIFN